MRFAATAVPPGTSAVSRPNISTIRCRSPEQRCRTGSGPAGWQSQSNPPWVGNGTCACWARPYAAASLTDHPSAGRYSTTPRARRKHCAARRWRGQDPVLRPGSAVGVEFHYAAVTTSMSQASTMSRAPPAAPRSWTWSPHGTRERQSRPALQRGAAPWQYRRWPCGERSAGDLRACGLSRLRYRAAGPMAPHG